MGFIFSFCLSVLEQEKHQPHNTGYEFSSTQCERIHNCVIVVNWSNCTAEYFIASDTPTSRQVLQTTTPLQKASALVVCLCVCIQVYIFCCTLGLVKVIGVLVRWICASPGSGQIAYDDHVLTRWLAGTTYTIGSVCESPRGLSGYEEQFLFSCHFGSKLIPKGAAQTFSEGQWRYSGI